MSKDQELLELLYKEKKIDKVKYDQIKPFLLGKDFVLSDYLIKEKIFLPEEVAEVRAKVYGLEYVNLLDRDIPEDILNIIPEEAARTYKVICFEQKSGTLSVALTSPNLKSMEAMNFIAREAGLSPRYYVVSETSLEKGLQQYQRMEEEISSALEVKAQSDGDDLIQITDHDESEAFALSEDINSAPVAKIVSVIIRHAVESRASDIHIEPLKNESRVRYRIDGILHNSLSLPRNIHNAIIARIKVLSRLKLDETRVPQDGRVRLIINNKEVDFRVSTLPLAKQEKIVMRILDTTTGAPTLEGLGFNNFCLEVIKRSIKKTTGILLVTGPTGSGKTTTLYAILHILNQEGVNISTLEDPIEYEIKGVNQSQVRPKIGYTFANGLRSFLRQDPDIIMVGEIRDEETAELSVHAGLTGHFVLSTLHTNDSIGSVNRLIDMKIEPFLLVSTLKAVIAQRLARRLCPYCKKKRDLRPEEKISFKKILETAPEKMITGEIKEWTGLTYIDTAVVCEPAGCPRCEETGYQGRIAVAEVIEMNDQVKDLIIKQAGNLNATTISATQDYMTMKQDGVIKVLQGTTNIEEVLRVTED